VLAAAPGLQGGAQGERDAVHALLHGVVQLVEDAALLQPASRRLLLADQAPDDGGDQRDAQGQVEEEDSASHRGVGGKGGWVAPQRSTTPR
jgi:hypothetical protein